jgi:serine/threonine protein phosphatase 1
MRLDLKRDRPSYRPDTRGGVADSHSVVAGPRRTASSTWDVWDWSLTIFHRAFRQAQLPLSVLDSLTETAVEGRLSRDPTEHPEPGGDVLVYGVGDVHGMNDLLGALLAAIEADATALGLPATVVFLGDVVNRGAQTRQVLDRLVAGPTRPGDRWIVLRGNHEQMMLDALTPGGSGSFQRWLKMGGEQTLASYGCARKRATPDRGRDLVGANHIRFLTELPLMHIAGDTLFVHAGVEPGVPLQRQEAGKLLTIRGRFLKQPHGLPFTVVHGHTPTNGRPRLGPGRIGVDTGAYFTGILTAVVIESNHGSRRFIRVPALQATALSLPAAV